MNLKSQTKLYFMIGHDGYVFMVSRDYKNRDEIGCYVDRAGCVQIILYYSSYGLMIRNYLAEIKM
jgi:hypothetical protein